MNTHNVLIVGAGPAGIGLTLELKKQGIPNVMLVDRRGIGASFEAWPKETKFITPSFPSQAYGCPDLNTVELDKSTTTVTGVEHPDGQAYAKYLRDVVEQHDLKVEAPLDVLSVKPGDPYFGIETSAGRMQSRCVVWATGEYGSPCNDCLPGLTGCPHYSEIGSWKDIEGDHVIILGGGESGADGACNLIELGKSVTLLDRNGVWKNHDLDPSWTHSPVTRERINRALATGRLHLEGDIWITHIEQTATGYRVHNRDGKQFESPTAPVNCLGFKGGGIQIEQLWQWNDKEILLTPEDESTLHPGLFLVGPQVRQPDEVFCFVYKFRTRFPRVAASIQARLALTPTP